MTVTSAGFIVARDWRTTERAVVDLAKDTFLTETAAVDRVPIPPLGEELGEGRYTVRLRVDSQLGDSSEQTTPFILDATPPKARFANPRGRPLRGRNALRVRLSDKLSGVARADLRVDGKSVATQGTQTLVYRPARQWLARPVKASILVVDRAGNTQRTQRVFPAP